MARVPEFVYLFHPKVAWILVTGDEKPNVMALAWAAPVDEDEEVFVMSVWTKHLSYENLQCFPYFSLNLVEDEKLVFGAGSVSGRKVDKIKKLGLQLERGKKAWKLKEALAWIEGEVIEEKIFGETAAIFAKVLDWGVSKKYDWRKVPLHVKGKSFARAVEVGK